MAYNSIVPCVKYYLLLYAIISCLAAYIQVVSPIFGTTIHILQCFNESVLHVHDVHAV